MLKSPTDTLSTISDNDGIFIFSGVKLATFVLTISKDGFKISTRKYFNNDLSPKIVIPPITLIDKFLQLKQVTINGAPTIIYKTDTVEYKASDYKVREYATVDELLKKMEGMEVGLDGSLTHQGQLVTKAKLNGRTFSGGDVAQAIQNLPAAIVDKIQIVDDYGEQAARTGIKDGDPQKVLNITTRSDKSIGTMARLTEQYGNADTYNNQVFIQRINANQELGLIGNLKSTIEGIASNGASLSTSGSGSKSQVDNTFALGQSSRPGVTKSGSPSFNYRDNWGSNIEAVGDYTYKFSDNIFTSKSYGQNNSSIGASTFVNNNTGINDDKSHNINLEINYNVNRWNFVQITPSFTYDNSYSVSNPTTNDLNYFLSGFEHSIVKNTIISQTTNTAYGITGLFVHSFKNSKRNFSFQLGYTNTQTNVSGDNNSDYRYYIDSTQNSLVRDSLSHLTTRKTSTGSTYRSIITYVEPISGHARLEFTGQLRRSDYYNRAISDTVLANGSLEQLARLDNIFNYSFTESKLTVDYRYADSKTNISVGAAVIPTVLSGAKKDDNTSNEVSTSRSGIRVVPIFRYSYNWSKTQRLLLTYTGANNEPDFQAIQPFIDKTDPNNIIVGNPNLKPTFTHTLRASYNKYFPNQKFNASFNFSGKLYENQITTNTVQINVPLTPTTNKTINEINYVNVNGDKTLLGNYSISKQLEDRAYTLSLNGTVFYNYTYAMSNNTIYHTDEWRFSERFGPKINPNENIEINPYLSYDLDHSFTNTLNATPTSLQTLRYAVEGRIYFLKTLQIHYYASKNYIAGLKNYSQNPFVINAGFEKQFKKMKNLVLTFDAFDLLHQNNFIQQTITPKGSTYTLSNTNSRYFLLGLRLNLQHWGGTPMINGKPMQRRGDGSFIR